METVEKINDDEIQISEPIVNVRRYTIQNLKAEKNLINDQIDRVQITLQELQLKKQKVLDLIQKARGVGVE